jgi:hypothetical protein
MDGYGLNHWLHHIRRILADECHEIVMFSYKFHLALGYIGLISWYVNGIKIRLIYSSPIRDDSAERIRPMFDFLGR